MTITTQTESTETETLYLNHDARLGEMVIGDEAEFSPEIAEGNTIDDYDVFSFTTLAQLLAHLMETYPTRAGTVEDACRLYLGMTGSEIVEKIA
jgi:hypothetical protein